MRIATWNVNSVRSRVARIVDWLVRSDVDALAMQEIKCRDDQFPFAAFQDAGYEVAVHGLNQWNGVAIASRVGLADVATGFPGMPGFAKGMEGPDQPLEARALGATVGDVRLWSLYVPNGRALEDPHYRYKLEWLEALRTSTAGWLAAEPDLALALTGDFNIAPTDEDNGDPTIVIGRSTHVSPPERAAFAGLLEAGLADVVRPARPDRLHLLGLPAAALPTERGPADRLRPRLRRIRRRRRQRVHRPRGAQGRGPERSRPGGRRPRRAG